MDDTITRFDVRRKRRRITRRGAGVAICNCPRLSPDALAKLKPEIARHMSSDKEHVREAVRILLEKYPGLRA